jgi:tripartite-type tricarboxylate transporter receptor subunit TctC
LHVPYKGGGAAVPDLLAGRVSMMLETIPNALPMSRSGKMRALAVTTAERSAAAPDLPTMAESGLPGFDVSAWTALYVPAGTPAAIIQRLNKETQAIAGDPHYVEQIKKMGTDVAKSTPEGLAEFMRKDIASWTQAVTLSGIKKID